MRIVAVSACRSSLFNISRVQDCNPGIYAPYSFTHIIGRWIRLKNPSLVKQLERESGKISTLIKLGKVVIKTEWSKTVPGEFPTTEWRSFPLQIPSEEFNKHVLGRLDGGVKNSDQDDLEVIHLPVYIGEDICDARIFEEVSGDPAGAENLAKVPVVSVATKSCGECSGSGVQTQSVSVLPVWSDGTSIVLDLEWYEGNPMEGGVNPEWFIKSSPKLSVKDSLQKLKESSGPSSVADKNCCHCLHVNPASLGTHVLGDGCVNSCSSASKIWPRIWKFETHEKMLNAIDKLSEALGHTFQ